MFETFSSDYPVYNWGLIFLLLHITELLLKCCCKWHIDVCFFCSVVTEGLSMYLDGCLFCRWLRRLVVVGQLRLTQSTWCYFLRSAEILPNYIRRNRHCWNQILRTNVKIFQNWCGYADRIFEYLWTKWIATIICK